MRYAPLLNNTTVLELDDGRKVVYPHCGALVLDADNILQIKSDWTTSFFHTPEQYNAFPPYMDNKQQLLYVPLVVKSEMDKLYEKFMSMIKLNHYSDNRPMFLFIELSDGKLAMVYDKRPHINHPQTVVVSDSLINYDSVSVEIFKGLITTARYDNQVIILNISDFTLGKFYNSSIEVIMAFVDSNPELKPLTVYNNLPVAGSPPTTYAIMGDNIILSWDDNKRVIFTPQHNTTVSLLLGENNCIMLIAINNIEQIISWELYSKFTPYHGEVVALPLLTYDQVMANFSANCLVDHYTSKIVVFRFRGRRFYKLCNCMGKIELTDSGLILPGDSSFYYSIDDGDCLVSSPGIANFQLVNALANNYEWAPVTVNWIYDECSESLAAKFPINGKFTKPVKN